MTGCAMIAGMLPMALGGGEGGGQSAPLGRAVIGGLAAATLATLIVLPAIFAIVQGRADRSSASLDPDDPESPHYHEDDIDAMRPAAVVVPGGLLTTEHTEGTERNGFSMRSLLAAIGRWCRLPSVLHSSSVPSVSSVVNPSRGVVVAILAVTAGGCERPMAGQGSRPASVPVARVEVVRPERRTVRRTVGEPGQLQAFETAEVHARIAGYVKSWTVNIGASVKKGQILAELAVPELEAELRRKQAAIEQAMAGRKQSEAAVEVARADIAGSEAKLAVVRAGVHRADAEIARWAAELGRVEQLFAARAQTGTLLDETRSKHRSAEATLEEVRAQVRSAEVGLIQTRAALDRARSDVNAAIAAIDVATADAHHARAMLAYARIEAPFDGVVTRRNIDTGDLARPGPDGPPLFVVARSDIVTIAVNVPEAFAAAVEPGDRASVKIPAMGGGSSRGPSRGSPGLDPRTRTIRVEVDIPNPEGRLRPGLYAYATVVAEEHAGALTVPATAIVEEDGKPRCVVVVDGKAARRPLATGLSDGTRVEIVSGLAESDAVVKAGAASLADGQSVQVVTPAG